MKTQKSTQPLLVGGNRAAGVMAGLQLLPVPLDQGLAVEKVQAVCLACPWDSVRVHPFRIPCGNQRPAAAA